MSGEAQFSADRRYCGSCGERIDRSARFCPKCGDRQPDLEFTRGEPSHPTNGPGPHIDRQAGRETHTPNSYGFLFAFVDSWKRQKRLRHLLNVLLIFVSFGTYLVVLFIEGLIHYHNLNSGKSEPYGGRPGQKVWTTLTSD